METTTERKMIMKREYSNSVQVAVSASVAIILYSVGEMWFSLFAVGIALLLTVDEYIQRSKGK